MINKIVDVCESRNLSLLNDTNINSFYILNSKREDYNYLNNICIVICFIEYEKLDECQSEETCSVDKFDTIIMKCYEYS